MLKKRKLARRLLGLGLVGLMSLALTAASQGSEVLATPIDGQTQMSSKNILNGINYFLVKQNPAELMPGEQVFLTKKGQIYTTVIPQDLENPSMQNRILIAKMNKDGSIKIMTLPNLGYLRVQTIQENNGNKRVFFVTNKGGAVNIYRIPFKAPSPPVNYPGETPTASPNTPTDKPL